MQRFDPDKYRELASRIDYSSRKCSDGLCCFLHEEDTRDIGVRQNSDIVLVRQSILLITLSDLITSHPGEYQACEHLKLETKVEDSRLQLEFRCDIYDNGRSDVCIGYPGEGECEHSRLSRIQQKYFPDIWHFLSFSADKFPEIEEFAYEIKDRSFRVPLPLL